MQSALARNIGLTGSFQNKEGFSKENLYEKHKRLFLSATDRTV
jgi:hypothetical protein